MIQLHMQECGIAFEPRDDGGKVMKIMDPASTITVVLPIPAEGLAPLAEWLTMPNEELKAKLDAAAAASGITIAGADDLEAIRRGLDGG